MKQDVRRSTPNGSDKALMFCIDRKGFQWQWKSAIDASPTMNVLPIGKQTSATDAWLFRLANDNINYPK